MRFLVDESCDVALSQALLEEGYNVLEVRNARPGVDDEWVINLALSEEQILLTEDKDFGRLIYAYGAQSYWGHFSALSGFRTSSNSPRFSRAG
jgi:predicted nuclease of predicted toxin-antitoxin system